MLDKVAVMAELETHIDMWQEGSTGRLLADVRRLLVSQGKELVELRDQIKAVTASETMYIERLKIADGKLKPRKRAKKAVKV